MVQSYLKIKPRGKVTPKTGDYEQFVDDLENFPGAVKREKHAK